MPKMKELYHTDKSQVLIYLIHSNKKYIWSINKRTNMNKMPPGRLIKPKDGETAL
jgi:hypothetical protein